VTDVREKTLRLLHGIDCRESILNIDFPKTRPVMFRAILSTGLIIYVLAGNARADGPYDSLLKYVPNNTNVIALIDIKGAFASPLAKKENWLEKGQPNNRGGLGFLPAEADTVVIASDINFNKLTRQFQVGLVKLHKNVPGMNEFATREGGTFDEIAGRATVLSPRDVYYVPMSASELAAVYPADRQDTSRWLRSVRASQGATLSPYLKAAAAKAGTAAVTIALDLDDVVDKTILKLSLPASPTVAKNKNLDLGRLANMMASVKGVTFQAKIENIVTATLTWEFGFDPRQFSKTLPFMVLELIDGQGVSIPDLDTWEVSFTETTMTFTGTLLTRDLKNIVSLFAFPTAHDDLKDLDAKDTDPDNPAAKKGNEISPTSTKRYFTTVNAILNDLKKTQNNPNYAKTATWHEKGAAQIAQLSRLRVDPAAVNAAMEAARGLQAIGASLRGVPVDVNALSNQAYAVTYRQTGIMPGGWWGWRPYLYIGSSQLDTNIPQIQASISKVIDEDQTRRAETWSQISRTMVDTGNTLSEKYKLKF
jgi:hypothetical protein